MWNLVGFLFFSFHLGIHKYCGEKCSGMFQSINGITETHGADCTVFHSKAMKCGAEINTDSGN